MYVPIEFNASDLSIQVHSNSNSMSNCLFRILGFQNSNNTEEYESPLSSPDMRLSLLSNLGTSFNVLNVGIALEIMENIYDVSESEKDLCSSSLIAGMITGQIVGGTIGDWLGRHKAMSLVMVLQVISSIGSALVTTSYPFNNGDFTIYHMLAIWRFILGVGCGGVYPLAAILTAESTSATTPEYRAKLVAFTFSMQGVGYLIVPLISYLLIDIFGDSSDYAWRTLLGLGCIPGFVLLFNRIRRKIFRTHQSAQSIERIICESERSEPLIEKKMSTSTLASTDDEASVLPFDDTEEITDESGERSSLNPTVLEFIRCEANICKKLCGTAGSWFLFDVLFYGNALFQRVVLSEAFGDSETVQKTIYDQILIALIALPGYFISVAFVGRLSPKYIQIQGFAIMAILYMTIGIFFDELKRFRYLLVIVYGLTFFFANFGPNATTFMLPSITFSPSCRSTLNGISAACGKMGALIGATSFDPVAEALGDAYVMMICALISIIGLLLTIFCVQELSDVDIRSDPNSREGRRRRKATNLAYGPLRNGEINKTFRGSEFWRRRNKSAPSLIDFDD